VLYVIIMQGVSLPPRIVAGIAVFLVCLSWGLLFPAVSGADVSIEGVMGETITLHGVSYVGNSVYLFLTGPGLPANGVTLTNTDLRADQGQFTVVGVDENQEWTYIWKTSRIASEINPGTYVVYVTNEPVDLSHLGGSSSYKTLSVYLKDSGESKVSIDAAHAYTLNPEEHVSTPRPAPSMNLTNITTAVTSPPPATTVAATTVQTALPTTQAGTGPWAAMTALACSVCLATFLRVRP
jgi:hypothetical protein